MGVVFNEESDKMAASSFYQWIIYDDLDDDPVEEIGYAIYTLGEGDQVEIDKAPAATCSKASESDMS